VPDDARSPTQSPFNLDASSWGLRAFPLCVLLQPEYPTGQCHPLAFLDTISSLCSGCPETVNAAARKLLEPPYATWFKLGERCVTARVTA
jgi:hypothetical protein